MAVRRVVIMGAAGRDFHNFNVVYRNDPESHVVAFTAAQIPRIEKRRYPGSLAGPRYPDGIPIVREDRLESLIADEHVTDVVFAYSDVSHEHVMHQASRVMAAGANFVLMGPEATMVSADVPVISVCAVRTGAGKSQTSRFLTRHLLERGIQPVVVRHPMPYGNLEKQRVQRFQSLGDLDDHDATIEEREEYEPHLRQGLVVYAGVDYGEVIRRAQAEADVIVWDGGNNDFPFVRSDLEIVVADPFRPGHECGYHPGEVNFRRADIVLVNKVGSAPDEGVEQVVQRAKDVNPAAVVVKARSVIHMEDGSDLSGRSVLVIEDGPTLTHGGMETGAGAQAARQSGASELVDPRPYAVGEIASVYQKYGHLGPILPAVGYFPEQLQDLKRTMDAVPAEVVVSATPFDVSRLIEVDRPLVLVGYDLEEIGQPSLSGLVDEFLANRSLPSG